MGTRIVSRPLMAAVLLLAGLGFTGCGADRGEPAREPRSVEDVVSDFLPRAEPEPVEAEPGPEPVEDDEGDDAWERLAEHEEPPEAAQSFARLCSRLLEEQKSASGDFFPEQYQVETLDNCMSIAGLFKDLPNENLAAETFVEYVMTSCEAMSGLDWVVCYGEVSPDASNHAFAVMAGPGLE